MFISNEHVIFKTINTGKNPKVRMKMTYQLILYQLKSKREKNEVRKTFFSLSYIFIPNIFYNYRLFNYNCWYYTLYIIFHGTIPHQRRLLYL